MLRPRFVLSLLAICSSVVWGSAADPDSPVKAVKALEPAKVIVTAQATVGAAPRVQTAGYSPYGPAVPAVPISLSKAGLTLFLAVGPESDRTLLIGFIPAGLANEFSRKYVANSGWALGVKSPTFAFTGRLTTEDEPELFPNGVAPILNDVPAFTLGKDRRVVLQIDAVAEVTRFNRTKFPPDGSAMIEGRPDTAAAELTILNDPVSVTATNRKADAVGPVQVTGTLSTTDGTIRLLDAVVKPVRK